MAPLWWDEGTVIDIGAWKAKRLKEGTTSRSVFIASLRPGREPTPLSRHTLCKRFRTACKALGSIRLETLTIHHGRHTFLSHTLAGGRTLAEVRDAAGHSNITVTSAYLHARVDDEEPIGNLFGGG